MTSINVQPSEHATRYVDPEGVPIPNAGQALLGGSSNAPKFGTLIPNRIFVGGIPSNTTEQELKTYFSSFGQVKDVKIINDRLGVSKGSYGFVTFENQEVAEKIIKNESETLIFKDRKLNIGHAIRKQQLFPRPADVPATFFFTGGAIPCGFQSGMPVFPLTGQDYSLLTQNSSSFFGQPGSAAAYQQMLLQQANGALYLSPQAANQHAAAAQYHTAALQSQFTTAQPNTAAAFAALQHQQYQQGALTAGQTSPAAVMAAAAAAVAAASQWSNATSPVTGNTVHQSGQHLQATPQLTPTHSALGSQTSPGCLGGVLDNQSPQVAALAAAVAAQQQFAAAAAWRWSNASQQQNAVLAPSPVANCSGSQSQTQPPQIRHESASHQQPQQQHQQLVFVPSQTAATFVHSNVTATSDYSTDYSGHSSGYLEPVEPGSFHCDGVMSPQQSSPAAGPYYQQLPQMYTTMFDGGIAATSSPGQQQPNQLASPQPLIPQKLFSSAYDTPSTTNSNATSNNNNPGQTSHQGSQTPHLYGTPTPQPIILDVFPGGGGLPLAQMKAGQVLSAENLLAAQVEHGGGNCLNVMKPPSGQRRNGGASPKNLSPDNGTAACSGRTM